MNATWCNDVINEGTAGSVVTGGMCHAGRVGLEVQISEVERLQRTLFKAQLLHFSYR